MKNQSWPQMLVQDRHAIEIVRVAIRLSGRSTEIDLMVAEAEGVRNRDRHHGHVSSRIIG